MPQATFSTSEKSKGQVGIFNVGSEDQISVTEVAQIVTEEIGPKRRGIHLHWWRRRRQRMERRRKNTLLDVIKLKAKGWKPKHNCQQVLREMRAHHNSY